MSAKRASDCPNLDSPVPVTSTKLLRAYVDTTTLPVDLLLEIVVRSDAVTIVLCAAVSRPLRAAILDHGFRRRLARRGFDPSLLRGISYKLLGANRVVRLFQTLPPSQHIPDIRSKLASPCFEPVAWRDGIIVFRRSKFGSTEQLTVCDSTTGQIISLPPLSVRENHYPPALLTVDDNFELLVADQDLGTRIYSSRNDCSGWSATRAAHHAVHPPPNPLRQSNKHPVVIGHTVHWLCVLGWNSNCLLEAHDLHIVALDVDTARATVIELPQGCVSRMNGFKNINAITLAVSGTRLLSLVVSETQVISMWSLAVGGGWSRRVLVDRQHWDMHHPVRFEGFGERSGTLLFHIYHVGLVQLNLATKEARLVGMSNPWKTNISQLCLHEVNLA
ncbi:unnamed protein product [Alopecurus aequalis]